jgi:hypothetical protein
LPRRGARTTICAPSELSRRLRRWLQSFATRPANDSLNAPRRLQVDLDGVTTIDPNIRSAYSQQASLQVERELSGAMSLSVAYLHVRGEHIILSRNVNVPRFESSGDSYYDGLRPNF